MDFTTWMKELAEIAQTKYGFTKETVFEESAWRVFYDEGFTPGEALQIDIEEGS
jgi:hypothetical protein